MATRDSGVSGLDTGSIAFPVPELPVKELQIKTYSKETNGKPTLAHARERAKTLSNTPNATLVKLLLREEITTKKTSHLLTKAVDQLGTARQRAIDAEASRRDMEVQTLLAHAKKDREIAQANAEARRAKEELEMYKSKLRDAEERAARTQQNMKTLRERQVEAERKAAQSSSRANKYRGQTLMMMAKEKGKEEGYLQGLQMGREVIGAKYSLDYAPHNGGAFIEEANSTPASQPRKKEERGSSRRGSKKDETRSPEPEITPRQRSQSLSSQPSPELISPPSKVSPAQRSPPRQKHASVPHNETPAPVPMPLTPPSIRAQVQELSPPSSVIPISSPQPHRRSSSNGSTAFPEPQIPPSNQPEVITIQDPAYTPSQVQSTFSHSPAYSHSSGSQQVLNQPPASSNATPLSDTSAFESLEYVPMPTPPGGEIQSPIPAMGAQNPEADRQREVDDSTPSTMTGMAGLQTFPSYVPTISSSGGGDAGGRPPSDAGSVSGSAAGRPTSRAGSVRSAGPGEWPGMTARQRDLSTIYENSEGTPRLTPMHTGNSLSSSQSQVRVDQWRKSLSMSDSPRSDARALSPMHSGPTFYTPQGTSEVKKKKSSSTASINIEVEPPSRTPSEGRRTPTQSFFNSHRSSSGGSVYAPQYPPSEPRQQPGYLSPNRSPLDLAPIQLAPSEPNPNEPPVIPGITPRRPSSSASTSGPPIIPTGQVTPSLNAPHTLVMPPRRPGSSASTSGPPPIPMGQAVPSPIAPHIYAHGFSTAPMFTPRSAPIQRPLSPADSDEDSVDESTTSSRKNLMSSLYGGKGASDIPPGAVTGGTPQPWSSSPSQPSPGSFGPWPPNPPPIHPSPTGSKHNPLPQAPQGISGAPSQSGWGPSPYTSHSPNTAIRQPPAPVPNSATKPNAWSVRKTSTADSNSTSASNQITRPIMGGFSPSLVSSLERTLPPDTVDAVSPGPSKRSSLHAGTTPILKPSSIGTSSGRSADEQDGFDVQTQTKANTMKNANMNPGKSVRMGQKVKVGVAGSSPYRPPVSLYK